MARAACQGEYRAQLISGNYLLLIAIGQHPTSGYTVGLEPYRRPNTYRLWHEKGNITEDIITPFYAFEKWRSDGTVKTVQVEDADGWHDIPVERVIDVKCRGGDGPFPVD